MDHKLQWVSLGRGPGPKLALSLATLRYRILKKTLLPTCYGSDQVQDVNELAMCIRHALHFFVK